MKLYTHTSNTQSYYNLYGIVSINDAVLNIKFSELMPSDMSSSRRRNADDPLRFKISQYENTPLTTRFYYREKDSLKEPEVTQIQIMQETSEDLANTMRQLMRKSVLNCLSDFLGIDCCSMLSRYSVTRA